MKTYLNKTNGITIIALVITIVILIILAGVLVNLTLGDNGLFTRAKLAKIRYEYATAKEIVDIKLVDIQAECMTEGEEYTLDIIADRIGDDNEISTDIIHFYATAKNKSNQSKPSAIRGMLVSANKYPQFKFLIGKEGNVVKVLGVTTGDIPEDWQKNGLPEGIKTIEKFEEEIGANIVTNGLGGNGGETTLVAAEEKIEIMLDEWKTENAENGISLLEFFEIKLANGKIDNFEEDENNIIIAVDGYTATINPEGEISSIQKEEKAGPVPQITYTLSSTEYNQIQISITISATIEEGSITQIESLDNLTKTSETSNQIECTINRNGRYRFKADSSTGKSSTIVVDISNIKITKPTITSSSSSEGDSYPIITENGIEVPRTTLVIDCDKSDDLKNLYSEDGGNAWKEHNGTITTGASEIRIKTVLRSNESISSEVTTQNNLASDAVGTEAYDGNNNTYYKQNIKSDWTNVYINVENSARGKKLNYKTTSISDSYAFGYIISYDTNGTATNLTNWIRTQDSFVTIPSDCVRIAFCLQTNEVINELWISN